MEMVNRLKEIQGEKSVREFARMLDIKSSTLFGYLQGRMPPVELIVHICKQLDISIWWLLTGEGEKTMSRRRDLEEMIEILQKKELAVQLLKRVVEMEDIEIAALLGLADYQKALRTRYQALDGIAACLDLILAKLGMDPTGKELLEG